MEGGLKSGWVQGLLNASARVKTLQLMVEQLSGGGIGQRKNCSKSCRCLDLGLS